MSFYCHFDPINHSNTLAIFIPPYLIPFNTRFLFLAFIHRYTSRMLDFVKDFRTLKNIRRIHFCELFISFGDCVPRRIFLSWFSNTYTFRIAQVFYWRLALTLEKNAFKIMLKEFNHLQNHQIDVLTAHYRSPTMKQTYLYTINSMFHTLMRLFILCIKYDTILNNQQLLK